VVYWRIAVQHLRYVVGQWRRAGQTSPEVGHLGQCRTRYAGDMGDYLKLSMLRDLSPGYRLGMAWLFPDEAHNGDGRHVDCLNRFHQWRHFDPDLFDALRAIVASGQEMFSHWRQLAYFRVLRSPAAGSIAVAGMYMRGLRALTDGMAGANRARAAAWYTSSFTLGTSLSFLLGQTGLI
jgi:hypothetical protein